MFNACFIPIIYFFYPETARLSLEQIDLLFTGPKVLLHLPESMRERHGVETGNVTGLPLPAPTGTPAESEKDGEAASEPQHLESSQRAP